jgi:chromosomal replication initiation ATPase DnaA
MFVSANQQIVLASDRAPKDIKNITDRLRTSLKVECIDIQPPGMRQD